MTKGERIREARERTGKSMTSFADAIGVSKQTLYKYENDIITNVPSDKIELIAELAGISPGYIMGWRPEYTKDDLKTLEKLDPKDIELLRAYHSAIKEVQTGIRSILGIEKE